MTKLYLFIVNLLELIYAHHTTQYASCYYKSIEVVGMNALRKKTPTKTLQLNLIKREGGFWVKWRRLAIMQSQLTY